MKISKAIETNEEHAKDHRSDLFPARFKALRLGNEALKRLKELRLLYFDPPRELLPGETEERTVQRQGKDITGDYFYEEAQK